MKVFISWSGSKSHQVALVFRDWLPSVLQAVDPYVSSEDIDKGSRWSTDISRELADSTYGILCVTRDNLRAAWLNFEAGALSKAFDRARVSPFLFGIDRADVTGPLLQFQSTVFDQEDIQKLVRSINAACEENALEQGRLDSILEVWWPQLEQKLSAIPLDNATEPIADELPTGTRSTEDVLAELLELSRSQQRLLSTPEELLPSRYLQQAFRAVTRAGDISPYAIGDLREALDRLRVLMHEMNDKRENEDLSAQLSYISRKIETPLRHISSRVPTSRHVNPRSKLDLFGNDFGVPPIELGEDE